MTERMSNDPCGRAMAVVDAMADAWSDESGVRGYAERIAAADPAKLVDAIEAMMHQSFVEGACRMFQRALDDGVLSHGA